MPYPDDSDDDYRAAEGRSGGRRRASKPARPAWDAATYGRPDDMRPPPRRSAPPPPPEDRYASQPPEDRYPSEDRYGAPADRYPSEDRYAPPADRYPSDDRYPSSSGYESSYGSSSDRYSPDAYRAAEPYSPVDPYPSMDPYPPSQPYQPAEFPPAEPLYPPEPEPFSSSGYSMGPGVAPGSFAPDRYTSFKADVGEFEPEAGEARYVASGLYLDSAEGGQYQGGEQQYPGGWEDPAPAEPAPSGSRAGRNLPAAIGVGVGLGAAVIASLFVWRPAFLGVVAIAVGIGIWELVRAIRTSGARPPLIPLVAGGALMTGLAWWGAADALTFGLVVTVLAVMVWRLADGVGGYARDVTAATFIAVYVPFLGGFAAMLGSGEDGALRVVATLAAVVLSDTGGYIAGVLFGRHPMAPSVSPKKSWEGLVGSLVATAVGSAILLLMLLDVSIWWGLLFGLAVSAASVVGDLGESMVKRDLGVKDMSTLLPGHGGLMDRLDSIVFAAPTAYLLLTVMVPAA